ncbi:hypothetical protein DSO57_1012318 [Entomophthora muscae]|uniref:Uncharacterized protein n=1 Tax=Entomophthora muscae TaxID=34485 RepID=A0ACC2U490_9FUNG|nr:hypothetical protein DSO57_1012318 [Entomophthora muscae]
MERSKHLRQYMSYHLGTLMDLSLHGRISLPPPQNFADALHHRTATLLMEWAQSFGSRFAQYQLAYLSLKERIPKAKIPSPNLPLYKPQITTSIQLHRPVQTQQGPIKQPREETEGTFPYSVELEALLNRGESILESLIPDILGLPSDAAYVSPPKNTNVYQTVRSSGLGSNRYQLEVNLDNTQNTSCTLTSEAKHELLSIYQTLSCRFQMLVLDHLALLLRERRADERLDEILVFHARIGDLLARCQALEVHIDTNCEDTSEDEFEEIVDCPNDPADSKLQPWELIEEKICRQKGLPFLREIPTSAMKKPPRPASNLLKRAAPSGLQKLYSKLTKR